MKKPLLRLSSPLLLLCLMGFTGSARWPLVPLHTASVAVAPETKPVPSRIIPPAPSL